MSRTKKVQEEIKYDFQLPEPEITLLNFDTMSTQVIDYWHSIIGTDEAYKDAKGEGVVVFVLDTTFKTAHPDLTPNLLLQYAKSFTNDTTDLDTNKHGIHCLGIIGASDNEIGVRGVAPRVKLVPIRGLNNSGSGTMAWISSGIRYAADVDLGEYNGYQRILSMSLGASQGSADLKAALEYANSKNVVCVAAAGNSGYNGINDTVNFPGGYEDLVITVASVGQNLKPSTFSSGGVAVDVAAFGEQIYSTYGENAYAKLNGTSMANPMVAGVCALIASKNRTIKFNTKIMEKHLEKFAKDVHTPGEDNYTGAGIPIIRPYFENIPDQDGTTPPPPPPPTPPTDVIKPVRTFNLPIKGKFKMIWGDQINPQNENGLELGLTTLNADTLAKSNVLQVTDINLSVTSTLLADVTIDRLNTQITKFFTNRGLVLEPTSDFYDALFYTAHFMKLIVKVDNVSYTITGMTGMDENGRIISL